MSDLNILEALTTTANKSKDYANNSYTNALIGTARGGAIGFDDVSPLVHKVSVKVSRKNLIPYPYKNTTLTTNGITFTDNGDGSITINGTATANAFFEIHQSVYTLPDGINSGNNYTLSCEGKTDGVMLNCNYYPIGATSTANYKNGGWLVSANPSAVKTIPDDWQGIYLYVYVAKDKTVNATIYPQIELGTVATPYTPYITDDTKVTIKSCGKNLFNIPDLTPKSNEYDTHITIECNVTEPITISAVVDNPIILEDGEPISIWRFALWYKNGEARYCMDADLDNGPKTIEATKTNPITSIIYRNTYITSGAYRNI